MGCCGILLIFGSKSHITPCGRQGHFESLGIHSEAGQITDQVLCLVFSFGKIELGDSLGNRHDLWFDRGRFFLYSGCRYL